MNNEIQLGKYRHFKGNEYEVIGIAHHSETMEEMVVYRALYGEGGLWVRPASMWNETVDAEASDLPIVKLSVVMEAYEEATNAWTYFYDLNKHENIYIFESGFMDDEDERAMIAAEPDRFVALPKKEEIYEDDRVKKALTDDSDLDGVFREMAIEWCRKNRLAFE